MKNKGFTLVELVATLIVLSIVAVIAVPHIYNSIKDYKQQTYQTQLLAIENAAKNWAADHAADENFPKENDETILVFMDSLQSEGFIDENTKNPNTSSNFNSLVFTIITCKIIEATDESEQTRKYEYKVIPTTDDYLIYLSELWVKNNQGIIDFESIKEEETLIKTIKKDELLNYIDSTLIETNTNSLKDIETSQLISNFETKIYAKKQEDKYIYTYEVLIS